MSNLKEIFKIQSTLQKKFNTDFLTKESLSINKFKQRVCDMLKNYISVDKIDRLENLHKVLLNKDMIHYNDTGVNDVTKIFYEKDVEMESIYHEFITKDLLPYFGFDFYFQNTPNIRFHFPGADNSDHYPRWHSDMHYGHPPKEINILIPLTINKDFGFRVIGLDKSNDYFKESNYNLEKSMDDFLSNKSLQDELEKNSIGNWEYLD